jgi:hypothetical protein
MSVCDGVLLKRQGRVAFIGMPDGTLQELYINPECVVDLDTYFHGTAEIFWLEPQFEKVVLGTLHPGEDEITITPQTYGSHYDRTATIFCGYNADRNLWVVEKPPSQQT